MPQAHCISPDLRRQVPYSNSSTLNSVVKPLQPKPTSFAEKQFEDIWLNQKTVGYIRGDYATDSGKVAWSTAEREYEDKKYYFTLTSKELWREWRDPNRCIGKRFGYLTNYLVLDVDRDSPYHHLNDGGEAIKKLFEALEPIGMTRCISIQSSYSEGLHFYFPFTKPAKSWVAAELFKNTLEAAGFEFEGGKLESFPNVKSDNKAQYNGHRLPLQRGSYILDGWLDPLPANVQNPKGFVDCWDWALEGQDFDTFIQLLDELEFGKKPEKTINGKFNLDDRLQWTGKGQSNENWGAITAYLIEVEGLRDPVAIEKKAWEWALSHGYEEYASYNEKRDKNHIRRWIKSRLTKKEFGFTFNGGGNINPNQDRADDCTDRLKTILSHLDTAFSSINQLFQWVCSESKRLFGIGISKASFLSRKSFWNHLLFKADSNESSTDTNSAQLDASLLVEEDKNGTHSWINGNSPNHSDIQGFEVVLAPPSDTNFNTEAVAIAEAEESNYSPDCQANKWHQCPGYDEPMRICEDLPPLPDGRVHLANAAYTKATTEHLEDLKPWNDIPEPSKSPTKPHSVSEAIRATSEQLRHVLGQACPFSGPGLWRITAEDYGKAKFKQLCDLVGGAV